MTKKQPDPAALELPAVRPIRVPVGLRMIRQLSFPHQLGICDRLFGRSLERHGTDWVELPSGVTWKLDLSNPTHRWLVYGGYQGFGFWRWAQRVRPQVIVDSGANIGQTVASFVGLAPERILAFEPGTDAFEWLDECVQANRLDGVSTVKQGLGEVPGTAYFSDQGPGNTHGAWASLEEEGSGQAVEVTTLDLVMEDLGVAKIDLWKLDMEGGELAALKGAEKALGQQRINYLYIEIPGDQPERIPQYLAQFGYQPFQLATNGEISPCNELQPYDDLLFICSDQKAS